MEDFKSGRAKTDDAEKNQSAVQQQTENTGGQQKEEQQGDSPDYNFDEYDAYSPWG